MSETHHIEIDNQGRVKVTVTGVSGPSCSLSTKRVQEALGTVESDDKTGEYFDGTSPKVTVDA